MSRKETMGTKDDDHDFLSGIMFAPSHSTVMVPALQDVIQADAAHIHFGKYTLYSAYGSMYLHTSLGTKILKDGTNFGNLPSNFTLS